MNNYELQIIKKTITGNSEVIFSQSISSVIPSDETEDLISKIENAIINVETNYEIVKKKRNPYIIKYKVFLPRYNRLFS